MARAIVLLLVLFQTLVPEYCTRLLPVHDIRTDETFAFTEDFLKLVLEYQTRENEGDHVYVPEHLDKEGYIINENGQLVPFKIYKKGGSRMCFLHPRNCRGGFHKRLIEEPVHEGINDLYELKVYKRKYKTDKNQGPKPSYRLEDNPVFDSIRGLSDEHNNIDSTKFEDNVYDLFPSLASQYLKGDINEIQLSDADLGTLEDMHEANRLLNDLSKGLGQVAEPPPLQEKPHIKAELEEYPAYELLGDYNAHYDHSDDSREDGIVFPPSQSVDLYAFRRRM